MQNKFVITIDNRVTTDFALNFLRNINFIKSIKPQDQKGEDEQYPLKISPISSLRGKLNLSNEQYNNFQKYINDSRNEWDRNI